MHGRGLRLIRSLPFSFPCLPLPPTSTLFPYTTLFRSVLERRHSCFFGYTVRARSQPAGPSEDRKSTRLNSSHVAISYAVFCLKKKIVHDWPAFRRCRVDR